MNSQTKQWWLPLLMLGAACGGADTMSNPTGAPPVVPPVTAGAAGGGSVAPVGGPAAPVGMRPATGTGTPGPITPPAGTGAGGGAPGAAPMAAPPAGMPGTAPIAGGDQTPSGMPTGCQGFKLDGLLYSPGGKVLPNTCEPYHPSKNNPYAVRCIDAWSWYKTEFPGDEFCILPPEPTKGVQYGVHPQGLKWFDVVSKGDVAGYAGLSDQWTMKEAEEESANYETKATTMGAQKYYRNYTRMRPGSHHMIVNTALGKPADERWYPVSEGGLIEGVTGLNGITFPGAQTPAENRPSSLENPPEDEGHYREFPASPPITFNMHHFNASGKTILKEVWTNVWWAENPTNPVYQMNGLDVSQVFTMAIPPGGTQDLHYSTAITRPIRLVEAFGHRHAWTTNFSAWVENQDGTTEIVYQSFEWLEEPTYRYDSLTQNPKPTPDARTDGAFTGVKTLMPGQKLHFNCHIEFTNERAALEKAPMPAQVGTLRFANEAFTAEMCILFGATSMSQMPAPVADLTPLPSFATID